MKILWRSMKSRRDSLDLSVRLTRRTATVTMSAPEAAWARAISWKLRYLPVPTIRRDLKARPAITSWSGIGGLRWRLYSGERGWANDCGGMDRSGEEKRFNTEDTEIGAQRSQRRKRKSTARNGNATGGRRIATLHACVC